MPSEQRCFVCGRDNPSGLKIQYDLSDPRHPIASFVISLQFEGYPGMAHGGIIAAVLDETASKCFSADLDAGEYVVTAKLTTFYRKPVPVEAGLIVKADFISRKGRICKSKAFLMKENEVLAECDALFAIVTV